LTYNSFETSVSSGSPAELYRFTYSDKAYRYCTLDGGVGPFTYKIAGGDEVFTPSPLRRSSMDVSEEMARNTLEITMPDSATIPRLFMAAPPEGVVGVTVYRFHVTDTDRGYVTIFKGRVLSVSFQDNEASLSCEPIFTSLRRPGLRRYYTPHCGHSLYGPGCRLLRDDWEIDGTVIGQNGNVLTIQGAEAFADGWFVGGVFRCGDVRRMVMASSGGQVTVSSTTPAINGKACVLLPGCNHLRSDCHTKFNNVLNFGGFDWMPLKNPYKGDNIFF
jgi:uncharacterized phage protein (TIGR02218 family)